MTADIYKLPQNISIETAKHIHDEAGKLIRSAGSRGEIILDFSEVRHIDSAGVVILDNLSDLAGKLSVSIELSNLNESHQKTIKKFSRDIAIPGKPAYRGTLMENIGDTAYGYYLVVKDFLMLLSNISFFGVLAFFRPGLRRKGEVVRQSNFIGVSALPIVVLVTFLIGVVLAIQAAVQMRPYGAEIFVAQLVTYAMVMELGPLLTAIMVAGRSGSAIAAELGAMKVSEEIDALRSMGIDPVPYLIIPKMFAILITMPMLTALANFSGIFGGSVIGYFYLQMDFNVFYNEVSFALRYYEVMTGFIKSIVFATIIIVVGSYFGLHVEGGAEGVGRATTRSVVVSIFLVIVADSILGLIFYIE